MEVKKNFITRSNFVVILRFIFFTPDEGILLDFQLFIRFLVRWPEPSCPSLCIYQLLFLYVSYQRMNVWLNDELKSLFFFSWLFWRKKIWKPCKVKWDQAYLGLSCTMEFYKFLLSQYQKLTLQLSLPVRFVYNSHTINHDVTSLTETTTRNNLDIPSIICLFSVIVEKRCYRVE